MKLVYKVWWVSLLIKLLIGIFLPLSFDESYYWVWSHHLQLSFFDHPPFVSWLLYLGQAFEGFYQAVRVPSIIMGHLTLWIWVLILKDHLSDKKILVWLSLALISPLLGVGSLLVTPDLPLMFFWSLGVWSLIRAEKSRSYFDFCLLGAITGLGFLAKYHMVLFLPCSLAWLIFNRAYSVKNIASLLIGFLCFMIFSSPVWIWNAQNDFISFVFQLNHGLGSSSWSPSWTFGYLLSQTLIFFPVILWFSIKVATDFSKKQRLLFVFIGWGPLLFFLLSSFKGRVEANWPSVAFPAILALAVASSHKFKWAKITIGFWALLTTLILSQAFLQWVPREIIKLKTEEFIFFDPIIHKIKPLIAAQPRPLYARSFQMASQLSFKTKGFTYKLRGLNRFDFFDMRPEATPKENYYVITLKNEPLPIWTEVEGHKVIDTISISKLYELKTVNIND